MLLYILFFAFAPHPKYIETDVLNTFSLPSSQHLLGTDHLGRDVYALLAAGAFRTLEVVFLATALSFLGGSFLGMLLGYFGGVWGSVIQFFADFVSVLPSFLAAMALSALFGFSPLMAGVVFGVGNMGEYINQAAVLTEGMKKQEFIDAQKVLGLGNFQIMLSHILPNIARQLFVFMGNKAAGMVSLYAGLAFIGLGTDITKPDWGTLLYQYRGYLTSYPLLVFWPTLCIVCLTLCFHLLFDASEEEEESTLYD
ncbi:MAG: ABC transporter permease [bacterium]|nr:ABC transporter permease [bacterium]